MAPEEPLVVEAPAVESDEEMPPVAEDSPSEEETVVQPPADSVSSDSEAEEQFNAKRSPVKVMT